MAKIQVLYSLKKEGVQDNPEVLATAMGRELKSKSDKIPPAYPCEGQALVFFVTDYFGKPEKKIMEFCKEIVPKRAAKVALVVVGKDDSANIPELEDLFNRNGVPVIAKCGIAVKKGLFGAGKVTDADVQKAVEFAKSTAASL